ncbi:hypothetical protein ACFYNF_35980 [Streptomyces sp. NPDC006641]|uniref:hypothetical protein n=1 Tax=unclassified Streptomyces TaxID=2593676 RepID=UPI002E78A6E4|nr:hypothetical protein [Streptomyces sp. JV184]MEE1743414.1 hypothetical protein [Streptomyces sp. JV184]
MLRVHFTDADLAAVHVALRPDPLWETVLGLQQLTHPGRGPVVFTSWRRRASAVLSQRHLIRMTRLLTMLVPVGEPYFPDLLTPAESAAGLAEGLAGVASNDRPQAAE